MAAYGALISLMNIIDTLHKHPSPPISIHKDQVQSLTQNITFLQEFLDGYISPVSGSHEADPLEHRIAHAVYAAEDVIESHIVLQIHRRCKVAVDHEFYQDLQKVIEEMNLIQEEVNKIIAKENQRHQKPVASSAPSSIMKENVMMGFDQVFEEVLFELTGNQLNRQIIPITGMGGIGKTTLAKNLFDNALVKEHFDFRAWTTISQTYNVKETLIEVLSQVVVGELSERDLGDKLTVDALGEQLHKFLAGRRYLVIIDDMWSVEVWDKIKCFFPDYENGSRILVTTRMSNLSSQLNKSYNIGMEFLDESSSWELFCKIVFVNESCPLELNVIGKNIVANCKGLPLSIVTIGGLLAKSKRTRKYWEHIEKNLNSIVITNNDEFCLRILRMSYIYLPNYLKPCFLYMGVFEEGCSIRVSMLKKLWVSEGFLKPRNGKCLETIAQEYFEELVDRNLILVDKLGSCGNVKYCRIHDLLRDLCLKEVEKERFYHVIKDNSPSNNRERRVIFRNGTSVKLTRKVLGSLLNARTIIRHTTGSGKVLVPRNLRLVRTFKALDSRDCGIYLLNNVFGLVNSRYLAVKVVQGSEFPSSVDMLWNLHTLIIDCRDNLIAPIEIWKLHQIRHLVFERENVILAYPPSEDNDIVIMENLETLKGVKSLYLNEEIVKRIPNVKKLGIMFDVKQMEEENCLNYLEHFSKLESLCIKIENGCEKYLQRIRFPKSLKKLSIDCYSFPLEGISDKIGFLPLLQKLRLAFREFETRRWEIVAGQFPSLKFLSLSLPGYESSNSPMSMNNYPLPSSVPTYNFSPSEYASSPTMGGYTRPYYLPPPPPPQFEMYSSSRSHLECWTLEDSCLPRLEHLYLGSMNSLEEIPSEIGEIPTLKLIEVDDCSESLAMSLKRMVQEQEESQGQPSFHVRVKVQDFSLCQKLRHVETPNFHVQHQVTYSYFTEESPNCTLM